MQNKSELIKQLETLPAFIALKKGLEQNLRSGNFYVDNFMPESNGFYDNKGDDGRQVVTHFHLSEDEREEQAVDELLADNGDYFDEFVHDDNIRNDVTEFMRSILKELRKCNAC